MSGDWQSFLRELNWVDWTILLVVLLAAFNGTGRGFVGGVLDLVGIVVSVGVATLAFPQAAALLVEQVEMPAQVANVVALLGLIAVVRLVYGLVLGQLGRGLRPLGDRFQRLRWVDRQLGIVPGAAYGLLTVAVIILPLVVSRVVPPLATAIEQSRIGGRITSEAAALLPEIETRWTEAFSVPSPTISPPVSNEPMPLELGPLGELALDPDAEAAMLDLVNLERQRQGLGTLRADEELRQVARAHSREMFERGYFGHTSPYTGSPFDRLRAARVPFLVAGENLAFAPTVRLAHDGLMDSPGHRENILRPQFGRVGIGVIRSPLRGRMFTQAFAN